MATPAERTSERIAGALVHKFEDAIDLSDLKGELQGDGLLTRALSAAYISDRFALPPKITATHVTDGFDDLGIDSITIHAPSQKIIFTQSKFFKNPDNGIQLADFLKFREGVRKMIELKFAGANSKILAKKADISQALSEFDYTIEMVVVTNSTQPASKHLIDAANEFIEPQNQYQADFLKFSYLGLPELSKLATRLVRPQSVNFKATIRHFGRMVEPIEVVYGLISGADVAALHAEHGDSIFFENVRFFLGSSDVNEGIAETVSTQSQLFPYFNNGITAICNAIKKAGGGGTLTDAGHFEFEGFSIVNGAQTVGSVSKALTDDSKKDPLIFVKVISLDKAPDNFARQVTRFTNTQNDLQAMDFVTLDPNQERLRAELAKLNVNYTYRRGQTTGASDLKDACDLREASVALACYHSDIRYAVYAKRNVSQLWEDINKEPYSALFNDATSASHVWNVVRAMRFVADELQKIGEKQEGRDALMAVHGNRFLFHVVSRKFHKEVADFDKLSEEQLDSIRTFLAKAFDTMVSHSDKHYPEAYAGNIFKNADRQREILAAIG